MLWHAPAHCRQRNGSSSHRRGSADAGSVHACTHASNIPHAQRDVDVVVVRSVRCFLYKWPLLVLLLAVVVSAVVLQTLWQLAWHVRIDCDVDAAACLRMHTTMQLATSDYFGLVHDYLHTSVNNNKVYVAMADLSPRLWAGDTTCRDAHAHGNNNSNSNNITSCEHNAACRDTDARRRQQQLACTMRRELANYLVYDEHYSNVSADFVERFVRAMTNSSQRQQRALIVYLPTTAVASFVYECLVRQRDVLLPPSSLSPRQQAAQQQAQSPHARAHRRMFVLITGSNDHTASESFALRRDLDVHVVRDLLEHPLLVRWYAQNPDIRHARFTALPIGLDYHTMIKQATPPRTPTTSAVVQETRLLQLLLPYLDVQALMPSHVRVVHVDTMPQWYDDNDDAAAAAATHADTWFAQLLQRQLYGDARTHAPPMCHVRWTTLEQLGAAPELAVDTAQQQQQQVHGDTAVATQVRVRVGFVIEPLQLLCNDDDDVTTAGGATSSCRRRRHRLARDRSSGSDDDLLSRVAIAVPCTTTVQPQPQPQLRGTTMSRVQAVSPRRTADAGTTRARILFSVPAAMAHALRGRPYGDPHRTLRVLLSFSRPWSREYTSRVAPYEHLRAHMHDLAAQGASSRDALWSQLRHYTFVASPPGFGYDCHRTWEALMLGCVPIVLHPDSYATGAHAFASSRRGGGDGSIDDDVVHARHALELFRDLPVIVVRDFTAEVTLASLTRWRAEVYANVTQGKYKLEKLFTQHWLDHMAAATAVASRE